MKCHKCINKKFENEMPNCTKQMQKTQIAVNDMYKAEASRREPGI